MQWATTPNEFSILLDVNVEPNPPNAGADDAVAPNAGVLNENADVVAGAPNVVPPPNPANPVVAIKYHNHQHITRYNTENIRLPVCVWPKPGAAVDWAPNVLPNVDQIRLTTN